MGTDLAETMKVKFEALIKALGEAQEMWEKFAGPCFGGCPDDCFNRELTDLKRRCRGVLDICDDHIPL